MNYKEMSNFQIDKAVAERLGMDLSGIDEGNFQTYNMRMYCTSWADAGPIIQSNRIMLNPRCADELWKAELEVMDDGFMKTLAVSYDKNPLRAAMIAFLMMSDNKDA